MGFNVGSPKPHHSLHAWQEAMALVRAVYDITRGFPKEETYGLISQLRRRGLDTQ